MRGIALVGLNSLYRSGATAFLAHLGSVLDDDDDALIVFNDKAEPKNDDIGDYVGMVGYVKDSDADALAEYEHVIFAAPRWQGEYEFLPNNLRSVGIIVHDINDFERMGVRELMEKYPESKLFCVDKTVKGMLPRTRSKLIKQPFNRNLLPNPLPHTDDKEFLVTSRPTPSKNHELIRKITEGYPLNILADNGIYTYQELAEAYSKAIAVIDASIFPEPHRRSQYSLLEAWYFGCPFLCFDEWFDYEEVIDGYSCLELTRKNIKRVFHDSYDEMNDIVKTGKRMLNKHHPDNVWQSIMEFMNE